jgi:Rrf2 family transcriptional regulator, nitric oxide-sensitive transcriptional repressor
MRLTTFTDYGLRTLVYGGTKGEQLSTVDEIAKTYGVSRHHMTKVVHHLGRRGYLGNVRGKRGGIALGREPSAMPSLASRGSH